MGAASARSRAFPCGTPSTISTRTTSPSSFAASQCAAVAPTLPAPTTVIFFRAPMSSILCVGQVVNLPEMSDKLLTCQQSVMKKGRKPTTCATCLKEAESNCALVRVSSKRSRKHNQHLQSICREYEAQFLAGRREMFVVLKSD